MTAFTRRKTLADIHHLHDVLNAEADLAAPWPAADSMSARAVIVYHAARGHAKYWLRCLAIDTDPDWSRDLDAAVQDHYRIAGLLAFLAGNVDGAAADAAAGPLTPDSTGADAVADLLQAITGHAGAAGAAEAERRMHHDIDSGTYAMTIGQLANTYGVSHHTLLDRARQAGRTSW